MAVPESEPSRRPSLNATSSDPTYSSLRDKCQSESHADRQPSVVRQTVDNLLSLARARFTFSSMSDALAVQMKGFGSTL